MAQQQMHALMPPPILSGTIPPTGEEFKQANNTYKEQKDDQPTDTHSPSAPTARARRRSFFGTPLPSNDTIPTNNTSGATTTTIPKTTTTHNARVECFDIRDLVEKQQNAVPGDRRCPYENSWTRISNDKKWKTFSKDWDNKDILAAVWVRDKDTEWCTGMLCIGDPFKHGQNYKLKILHLITWSRMHRLRLGELEKRPLLFGDVAQFTSRWRENYLIGRDVREWLLEMASRYGDKFSRCTHKRFLDQSLSTVTVLTRNLFFCCSFLKQTTWCF